MPQDFHTVNAPDGKTIQFPTTMSQDDIQGAMQKLYPPTKPAPVSGGASILDRLKSATLSAAPAIGAVVGGALGSVEPGGGNIAGAALGGAAGEQIKRLIQGQSTTTPEALGQTAVAGAGGAAGEMGGQIIGKATQGVMTKATDLTKEWPAINEAIGATKTAIRVPKSAGDISEAVTMPARGLQKEGFDAATLSKMSPIEQQAAVYPKYKVAGDLVDKTVGAATQNGVTLNPSQSALQVVSNIKNPGLQEQAVKQLDSLMQELHITDASNASPTQVLNLRRALQAGARFGPNGDLNSLGGIRKQLYGAVSGDLTKAVPELDPVDTHYSDLASAMKAINNSVSKSATQVPMSPGVELLKKAAGYAAASALGASGAGGLYAIWKAMH